MRKLCNQGGQCLAFGAFFNKILRIKVEIFIFYSKSDKILRGYLRGDLSSNFNDFQYLFLFFLNKQN